MWFKKVVVGLSLVLACCSAGAQWLEKNIARDENAYRCGSHLLGSVERATRAKSHEYDVLRYKLALSLSMTDSRLQGDNRIRFRSNTSALSRIALTAKSMAIDSVKDALSNAALPFSLDADSLYITLGKSYAMNDTGEVAVFYRTTTNRRGYYFYTAQESGTEPVGYTMSEPYDARYWMPCYDEPFDKATAEMSITVPQGFTAASIGRLESRIDNLDGTTTFHWATPFLTTTYLMCVTVSRYAVLQDQYVRPSSHDTIPIVNYVWRRDSAAAREYFRNIAAGIRHFETVFGVPYPFEKYGQAAVRPFSFGGMEHQTMTTLNQNLLSNESLVMHELAHHWWGNMTTCESFADLWLNEGFATYSEALWQEYLGGRAALKRYMLGRKRISSWRNPIYNPPAPLFIDEVYGKAAWVLQMLRKIFGEEKFRELLRVYGNRYKYSVVNTAQFQQTAEEVYGGTLSWFFNQWIFGTGVPRYDYSWTKSQSGTVWTVALRVRQTQPGPIFAMPIEFAVQTALGKQLFIRRIESRDTTVQLTLNAEPQSVAFDEDEWVLKESANLVSVARDEPTKPTQFRLEQNYPNPFNPNTVISYQLPVTSHVKLVVYDVLGRELQTLVNTRQSAGRYRITFTVTANSFGSGIYFYRLQAGTFSETKKMILRK